MRVLKKSFMSACVALALVLMLPSMNVCASSDTDAGKATYTVTFRPGKVGEFTAEAKRRLDGTVTGLGAIKVEVKAGEAVKANAFKRYIEKHKPDFAIRFSALEFIKQEKIFNIPLYLVEKTREII